MSFEYAYEEFCFFQFFEDSRETIEKKITLYDEATKPAEEIKKLTRLRDPGRFVISCSISGVNFMMLSVIHDLGLVYVVPKDIA